MTSPNVPLLQRTLAHIEANPEEWDQGYWRNPTGCGTAYCFAGWAAILHGAQFANNPNGLVSFYYVVPPGGDPNDRVPVDAYAAEILGIPTMAATGHHGGHLFDANNDLDDLRRIVGDICESAGGAP